MIKISIKRFQGKYCIFLRDLKSNAECPYSSLDSLLRNWMIIGE